MLLNSRFHTTEMTPKSTIIAFLLLPCFLALGSASGHTDADCIAVVNKNFAAAYPQCVNNQGLENMETEDQFQHIICDKNCGTPYFSLYIALCPHYHDPEMLKYYRGYCKVNTDGRPCYSYYKNSAFDMAFNPKIALQLCKPSIKYMCSDKCSSQLRAISTHYGSCIGPLFNSSYFHSSDVEYLPLFSYQLWTNCGVPIPTPARRGRAKMNAIMYYY